MSLLFSSYVNVYKYYCKELRELQCRKYRIVASVTGTAGTDTFGEAANTANSPAYFGEAAAAVLTFCLFLTQI